MHLWYFCRNIMEQSKLCHTMTFIACIETKSAAQFDKLTPCSVIQVSMCAVLPLFMHGYIFLFIEKKQWCSYDHWPKFWWEIFYGKLEDAFSYHNYKLFLIVHHRQLQQIQKTLLSIIQGRNVSIRWLFIHLSEHISAFIKLSAMCIIK